MKIYCCNCQSEIDARLTDGSEVYPHRKDLYELPFWKCDNCEQFVGCHHKTSTPTKPLGVIPSPEIKQKRQEIHVLLDQIWKSGRMRRGDVYKTVSEIIGKQYHTAEIRTVKEAECVISVVKEIRNSLGMITF